LTPVLKFALVDEMNNWNTSTTGTNGVTVKITYYTTTAPAAPPLTEKQRKERERTRKWLAKCNERHKIWFEKEMARLREEAKANAWRPQVSNSKTSNPFELNYWTIYPGEENEMDPLWKTTRSRYKKGWCGMTVNDPSPYERERIDAFIKKLGKKNVLVDHHGTWFEWDESDSHIGGFIGVQMGVWFRALDDHNAFVAMLDGFPKRDQMFILGEAADADAIRHLLEGVENYSLVEGDRGVALTMPSDSNNAVLVKMFVG